MKIRINSSLQIVVDEKKCDCSKQLAHCHVVRNGTPVALVWLNPVRIEYGHSLDYREASLVYETVLENLNQIQQEYDHNHDTD